MKHQFTLYTRLYSNKIYYLLRLLLLQQIMEEKLMSLYTYNIHLLWFLYPIQSLPCTLLQTGQHGGYGFRGQHLALHLRLVLILWHAPHQLRTSPLQKIHTGLDKWLLQNQIHNAEYMALLNLWNLLI